MGNTANSIDNMLVSANQFGAFSRSIFQLQSSTVTAAGNTSGAVAFRRFLETITVPSMANGATGLYLTEAKIFNTLTVAQCIVAYEVLLGTLNMSSNAFAQNNTFPSRIMHGSNKALASSMLMLTVANNVTATNANITITYTNQDNNANQSCNMILPSNAILPGAYLLNQRLAAGDVGVRAVTGMGRNAGTGGNVQVHGLIPLVYGHSDGGGVPMLDPLQMPVGMLRLEANDVISFWDAGSGGTGMLVMLYGVADN